MANTVISLKKSATPSATPSALANGELAINYADGKLFYKAANGTIVEFASGGGAESSDFGTVNVGGTLLVSDVQGDILTITAGDNIVLTPDAGGDSFSISAPAVDDAFAKANTAQTTAVAAFGRANTAGTDATNAFGQANSATTIASAAFDQANTSSALELYAENPSSPTAPSATGTNAVAIGTNSSASGFRGIALGAYAVASGDYSFAGNGSTASGSSSTGILGSATQNGATAIGSNSGQGIAQAAGQGAMALGGSYASGTNSFAAAIATNSSSYGATGSNSVAIGDRAKVTFNDAFALGEFAIASNSLAYGIGSYANASGQYAFALGGFSNASGQYAYAIGTSCTATAQASFAVGRFANASLVGKYVFSAGRFSSNGDAQTGTFVLRSDTTDATPEALTTNNSAAGIDDQIILPNNSAYAFHGTIVARQQASQGTACAAWKIEGLIRREGSAGTTVLVNSATTVLDNTPAWGMALSADTTNGGLKIEVTGAAATNIRWVATIHTSEVTY